MLFIESRFLVIPLGLFAIVLCTLLPFALRPDPIRIFGIRDKLGENRLNCFIFGWELDFRELLWSCPCFAFS